MGFEWTDALAIGIPEIDAQHQELFRRVDRLLEATLRGDSSEVGPLLAFLHEYTLSHFRAEERLMIDARYPGHRVHQAEHQRFVARLAGLEERRSPQGTTSDVLGGLVVQVGEWLRDHVYLTDTALGRFLKGV